MSGCASGIGGASGTTTGSSFKSGLIGSTGASSMGGGAGASFAMNVRMSCSNNAVGKAIPRKWMATTRPDAERSGLPYA